MERQAIIVTDISFGDAGKGTTVDYLVRQSKSALVIRHNGGVQAAHNVVTADGYHHTFAQFGSGSMVQGVLTHLSRYMLINPLNMFHEAEHLKKLGINDIWERVSIDKDALIITPWQRSANRLRELARGNGRHGSTGQGVGETQWDALETPDLIVRVGDLLNQKLLRSKLEQLRATKYDQLRQELDVPAGAQADQEWKVFTDPRIGSKIRETYADWVAQVRIVPGDYLNILANRHNLLVFEGAQGVLLDEWYGFHPYTTWSTTTHSNALTLLGELDHKVPVTRLGVMRAYTTRHGAGPFVTEDIDLTRAIPDYHNGLGEWQGSFRVGWLDLLAHQYALQACGETDGLVVTGLDRMAEVKDWKYCIGYRLDGSVSDADNFFNFKTDGTIGSIKLGVLGDLDRQARLTELLFSCLPVHQSINPSAGIPDKQDELLRAIEARLDLPILLASFGPTAADKRSLIATSA